MVGHRGVEPRCPAVSARCRLRLAHAPCVLRGPGSARTCSCRVSTGRSTVRASGPEIGMVWSRRRGSNPLLLGYGPSALPSGPRRRGWCGRRESNPHRRHGPPGSLSVGRRPRVGRPGGNLTPVSRSAAARLNPRPPGVALPARGSNSRLPGNSRTSVPLDHLASAAAGGAVGRVAAVECAVMCGIDPDVTAHSTRRYRDGESNPGLRGESPVSCPLDDRGELRGGSGATRTPRGLEDPYLFSRQAPDPAGSLPNLAEGVGLEPTRAGRPYPLSKRDPHPAGSLPSSLLHLVWSPRWELHPRPRPYRGRARAV
ncbi:MAG: hypothetical protein QOG43_839 [Actinomycetota bacterium]|nr:hypothetical protein [Actinomycetota bacterium]